MDLGPIKPIMWVDHPSCGNRDDRLGEFKHNEHCDLNVALSLGVSHISRFVISHHHVPASLRNILCNDCATDADGFFSHGLYQNDKMIVMFATV